MKKLYIAPLCFVYLTLVCCRTRSFSHPNAFKKPGPGLDVQVNPSYELEKLKSQLSAATQVPSEKMSFISQAFVDAGVSGIPDASNTFSEMMFSNLTPQECVNLMEYHSQGYKKKSEVDCKVRKENYTTTDFIPPAMQALVLHFFIGQRDFFGGKAADVSANCWTTSYEITRFRNTGAFDFTIFRTELEIEKYFQDPRYFAMTETTSVESSLKYLETNARPGDLVQFYKDELYHSAVFVSPGLLFEKTGFQNFWLYRLVLLQDILLLRTPKKLKILRPTTTALSHPKVFLSGDMGGNISDHRRAETNDFMVQLPPFVKGENQRFRLPPEAYQNDFYKIDDLPWRPLRKPYN